MKKLIALAVLVEVCVSLGKSAQKNNTTVPGLFVKAGKVGYNSPSLKAAAKAGYSLA